MRTTARPRRAGRASHPPSSVCELHDAGRCRSCPHLTILLTDQLEAKQARVTELLAEAVAPVPAEAWLRPAASAPTGFRNKAKMVVSGRAGAPVLGILDRAGRGVDLRDCPLHVPEIRHALPVLARIVADLGLEPYDVPARRGELKHLLVTASPDGDLMIRFVLRSRRHLGDLRRALPRLQRALPTTAVVSVNRQPEHRAIIEGEEEVVLTDDVGGDRLLMRLRLDDGAGSDAGPAGGPAAGTLPSLPAVRGGRAGVELPLFLPTRSFFQTNTGVAEQLYATARAWVDDVRPGRPEWSARLDGAPERLARPIQVWDLFCGVGGFALALAGPGRHVTGVEVAAPAITGARDAAALMGLGPDRVRFEAGDARVLDPGASGPGVGVPDLLVVNPPRRGIGADLAARIEGAGVPRVLYSSCNPASLAADLARMPSLRARRARLFDMFPHTDHAEVLVELVR